MKNTLSAIFIACSLYIFSGCIKGTCNCNCRMGATTTTTSFKGQTMADCQSKCKQVQSQMPNDTCTASMPK